MQLRNFEIRENPFNETQVLALKKFSLHCPHFHLDLGKIIFSFSI